MVHLHCQSKIAGEFRRERCELNCDRVGTVDVTVVIVSWNVAEFLVDCIESIASSSLGLPPEVIVVDNASSDDTLQVIRQRFPWVRLIANRENVGFARANNQGFALARGRFVLILNPDTVLSKRALSTMVRVLKERPEVGMVGPRLVLPDGKIQPTCARRFTTLGQALFCEAMRLHKLPMVGPWFFSRYYSPYSYRLTQEVEAISGAAMLVRRDVLGTLGGFAESFAHCGEDVDLCFRLREAGHSIVYAADCVVYHLAEKSSQQAPVRAAVDSALSVQEYFRRRCGSGAAVAYRVIVQSVQIPVTLVVGVAKFLLGRESSREFRDRLALSKAIWLWRPIRS